MRGTKREEPGVYMDLDEVEELLLEKEIYGLNDLVDMDLFYTYGTALSAVQHGELKHTVVNTRHIAVLKEDVLDYWKQYRNTPEDDVHAMDVTVCLSIAEVEYLSNAREAVKKLFNQDLPYSELIRNMINFYKDREVIPQQLSA